MCGICGFIRYDRCLAEEDHAIVERMNKQLIHRGPDEQQVLITDHAAFGFCRLSIIGLSNGMQPIYNEDNSLMVICNGEIFNYIELRKELIDKGHRFRTLSDVEVLLHLYEEEGFGFLNKLNGQFAFVIYDQIKNTFFCARDQMGIVPFYYTKVGNAFIFGSEVKAILQHPAVSRSVDLVGLDQVFTFAGLISPRTMFRNIRSLENGHYLIVSERETTDVEYWDLIYPETAEGKEVADEKHYIEQLEQRIDNSLRYRLRSEVPVGFYLSGGLDSSIIGMKVSQLVPEASREAFSIDFIESQISEAYYQQMLAVASKSVLNKKTFFFGDIADRLGDMVYHCECPVKETYNTASMSLSQSVRSKGIKVILSGEGADELFAGYVGYRFDRIRDLNFMPQEISKTEELARIKVWGDRNFFYENNFDDITSVKKQIFSDGLVASYSEMDCLQHKVINHARIKDRSSINRRSYVDFKLRLVDHLVSDHGDRMALANSVEVRYPFLDKDLVEFSTRVPADLKLNDVSEKYILKKMASTFLPKAIIEREKFGFVAPGSPYLLQKNAEYFNDILSYNTIKRQGYFNPDVIEQLKTTYRRNDFKLNIPFESDLLITVITFGILLNKFFDNK